MCCGGSKARGTNVTERDIPQGAEQTELTISGMSCGSCVAAIERALGRIEGVYRSTVQVGRAVITYDPSRVSEHDLAQVVEEAGYEVVTDGQAVQSSGCC